MPSLVVNPAGRVEDILGHCKVGHVVMLLGQPDGRSIKGDWGALASAKEFTLETEGHISHPRLLPERMSGRDIQSLPGGGLLCLGEASYSWEVAGRGEKGCRGRGGGGTVSLQNVWSGVLKYSLWCHNILVLTAA